MKKIVACVLLCISIASATAPPRDSVAADTAVAASRERRVVLVSMVWFVAAWLAFGGGVLVGRSR